MILFQFFQNNYFILLRFSKAFFSTESFQTESIISIELLSLLRLNNQSIFSHPKSLIQIYLILNNFFDFFPRQNLTFVSSSFSFSSLDISLQLHKNYSTSTLNPFFHIFPQYELLIQLSFPNSHTSPT